MMGARKSKGGPGPDIRDTSERPWDVRALPVFCLDFPFYFLLYMYSLLLGVSGFGTKCANLSLNLLSFPLFFPFSLVFFFRSSLLPTWSREEPADVSRSWRAQTTPKDNRPKRTGGRADPIRHSRPRGRSKLDRLGLRNWATQGEANMPRTSYSLPIHKDTRRRVWSVSSERGRYSRTVRHGSSLGV
ncbi:hypothetical protein L209DRAFT_260946 [Thermothelomyces heterothallicus CBS 203.75]